jgi:hypothetical protein
MNKYYAFLKIICFVAFTFGISTKAKSQIDTIPPAILITQTDTNCIQIASVFVLKDPIITDNQSDKNSITVKLTWLTGPVNTTVRAVYVLKVEATDSNGNKSIRNVNYKVDDCIPPVIDLQTSDTVCVKWRTAYKRIQPKVSDNYYPSNQVSLALKMSDVDPNIIGLYTDVYEAIDASGNKTTKIRIVKVSMDCAQTASINSFNSIQMEMYPNPAQNFISVQMTNLYASDELLTIMMVSMDGKKVFESTIDAALRIDVGGIANGPYTIVVKGGGQIINKMVLVQH